MNERNDVLISYSNENINEVKDFVNTLQKRIPELKCAYGISEKESEDEYIDKIINSIAVSDNVLFMVSDSSMASDRIKKELTHAKNLKRRVIPVMP